MNDIKNFFAIEKRHKRRWELVFYLRIFDQSNGEQLGHVIDISEEGMMVLSEVPIEVNKDFDLSLELPASGSANNLKISFKARSLWQSEDTNPDLVDTGFQLINPEIDSINAIKNLINELQF